MRANQRALDSIAINLSNLGTTGYKRVRTANHQFEIPREHGPVRGLDVTGDVDFSQGELNRTGRSLDLALYGEGFFAVESGRRGEVYTREGSFHLTDQNVLVTEAGHQVAWESLTGTLEATGLSIEIDGEGVVRQGGAEIGRLRIVDFEDRTRLKQDANGYWRAPRGLKQTAHSATVHQGALEDSNASGMEELVAMITIQRSFESVANVMSSIEDSYRRLTQPF